MLSLKKNRHHQVEPTDQKPRVALCPRLSAAASVYSPADRSLFASYPLLPFSGRVERGGQHAVRQSAEPDLPGGPAATTTDDRTRWGPTQGQRKRRATRSSLLIGRTERTHDRTYRQTKLSAVNEAFRAVCPPPAVAHFPPALVQAAPPRRNIA